MAIMPLRFAGAQEQSEEIIRSRIAHFREIGTAYKRIGDELKSERPDFHKIQEAAQLIRNEGAEISRWFPAGSEPPAQESKGWLDRLLAWLSFDNSFVLPDQAKSHAKLAVWKESDKFEQAHRKFNSAADQVVRIASSGQSDAIGAEVRKLGGTCKGCHDEFREKLD